MENKKTKLTISGSPKKTLKTFDNPKVQGKKTVIIGKSANKQINKLSQKKPSGLRSSYSDFKRGTPFKPNFPSKLSAATSDFERRKLAEQIGRAHV